MRSDSEVLEELISAFRHASQQSGRMPNRDIFNEQLTELVMAKFSQSDRNSVLRIQQEGQNGLFAARSKESDVARQHFSNGDKLLNTLQMSREARALANSFFAAQKAYFLYTQKKFSDAMTMLSHSFSNDLFLETECGLHILRMHRVQLINNWMRLDARQDCWRSALTLGCTILQYLECPKDHRIRALAPPWCQGWADEFETIPTDLVVNIHAQIAAELVQTFHHAESGLASPAEVGRLLGELNSIESATQIDKWVQFQIARIDRGGGDYFSTAISVVKHGRVPSAPLWKSVANDIARLLRPGLCILAASS